MILAVEGPSAAGKTTWCRATGRDYVPEYLPTGLEPSGEDRRAQADYWVGVNSGRWRAAVRLEAEKDVAVCDSDPLKLHYAWCLARVGAEPASRFEFEYARVREAMMERRIGFADTVLLLSPDQETLRRQKAADATRARRSFELHVQLREPLCEWYDQLDALSPGRVKHDPGMNLCDLKIVVANRYDVDLLDALIKALPII
ncbi:hypothetical protein [Microbacterium enclense]|uniref:hypothetical protein n=1 Tax=Microbacterium enclense TaxID=993073 RepID=UPI003F7E9DBD